jgi:hypothetical protein
MNQNYNFVQGLFSQVMNGKNEALATKKSTSFKGLLSMIVVAFFASISMQGQTTLISPTGDGGFENGSTFAANGWTVVNSSTDSWVLDAVPAASNGARCAYISSTPSTTATWTYSQFSVVQHMYYDVTIPANQSVVTLSFKWKAGGEGSGTSDYDNLKVFWSTVTNIGVPVANTAISSTYQVSGAGSTSGMYKLSSSAYNSETISFSGIPGTTYRLVLSWKSDSSDVANPPAAVDEISLISRAPGTFTSIVTGNWNSPSTWDANAVPNPGDNAIVSTGHTVTADRATTSSNNLTVNGTLAYATACTNVAVGGNLTVASTGIINVFTTTTGKTLTVAGDITNDGRIDLSVSSSTTTSTQGNLTLNGSNVQTVSGSGTFGGTNTATSSSNTAGVIRYLTCANTSSATPNIIWSFNNVRLMNGINTTGARINLGSNKIILGNYGSAGGTITMPVNSGFLPGGKFSRWWTNASTGTSISTGADPTNSTSRYPFINSTGLNRAMYITRTNTTSAVAGELAVVYNDATSITTGLSVVDGAYTINNRYNGNWAVSTEGTSFSSSSYTVALIAQNTLYPANGNARVMGASAAVSGTHQNGTATPGAQRTLVSQLDLLAGPLYIGVAEADIPYVAINSGNWNDPTIWNKGTVPPCTDLAVIAAGVNVTVNSSSNVAKGLTVNSGGTLTVASGDLTVGCTLNNNTLTNNGTLTVSGGTLNVNGSLSHSGTQFNQSGGNINIDGNAAGVSANSASSYHLNMTAVVNWTGGTLTIVDPHASTSSTDVLYYSLATSSNVGTGHTLRFGDGVSTDAGGNVIGFKANTYVGSGRINYGNLVINGASGTNRIVTGGTYTNVVLGNLTINTGSEYAPAVTVFVAGDFLNNGTFTQTSTLTLASFAGTSSAVATNPQTISGSGVFRNLATSATANLTSLTVNNSNATGVTLSVPLSVSGTLTMTSGLINTTSTNLLTLGTSTAAGILVGTPSATNMIVGPFARTFATRTAAANGTFDNTTLFPVGKGTAYTPVFVDPSIAAASAATISGEAFATNSGSASPDVTNLSAARWEVLTTTGFTNVINTNIRVQEPNILSTQALTQAPTAAGVYDRIAGTSSYSATGPVLTGAGIGASALTASGYFAYGVVAPPTPPSVTSYSTAFSAGPNPTLCQTGGSVVTIIGTNLATVTQVLFSGASGANIPGNITAKTSTSLTVTAPAGLIVTTGSIVGYIEVINPAGNHLSPYHFFTAGAPTVSVTANLTACAATGSPLTATGANTYSWAPNTALSSSTGASVIASPTANTTYTVTGTDTNGCTATNTVAITILQSPPAITASASSLTPCLGSTVNLTSTSGNIAVNELSETFDSVTSVPANGWTFLNAGSGNAWTLSTSTFRNGPGSLYYSWNSTNAANAWAISPVRNLVAGVTYTISYWYVTYGGSYTEKLKLTVGSANTVAAQTTVLLDQPSITNSTYTNASVTFTPTTSGAYYFGLNCYSAANQFYLSVDDFTITSPILATYSWSSSPTGFTSTDQNPTGAVVNGATTYTVTATASGCSRTSSIVVNPLPLPSAPTATNSTQCGTLVPTASVAATSGSAGNRTFKWYAAVTGGTALQSSTSTTYTTAVSATTTFYVSEVGTNGCESLRTPVTVTISAPPVLTVSAAPSAICAGASTVTPVTITSPLANYDDYSWTPSTGVSGTSSTGYTFNPTATTTYSLASSDSTTGCANAANVVITVNPLPVITSVATSTEPLCIGSSTTLTGLSLNLVSGTATIGTATTRTSATEQPTAFCNRWGSYRMQLVYTAAEIRAAGFSAGNITSIAFDISTLGDSATNSGFIVKMGTTSLSTLTQFESTTGYTTVFPSQTYTHTATGVQTIPFSTPFVWDGTSNIIIEMVHDGADLTNNSRTYFTQTTNNTVAYTSTSATDTASLSNKRLNIIFGGQIRNDISSNFNWSWAPAATLSSATGNVVVATPAVNTVYTATATNPTTNCSATATVSVSLLPLSATAPTATSSTHCGLQLSTATVTSTTTTVNPVFLWYTVASGGTSVQGGPSRTFLTAINSTRTMYVAEVGPNGCESLRTPVVMTVNAPPVVTITSSVPTFCGTGGATTLTANSSDPGMTYTWTSFTGTTTTSALNTRVITATLSETSEFKVVGIATDTSCLPIEAEISVGVYPLPTATVTSSAQGVCPGTSATIGSGLSAGNFSATCIPAPSGGPATSPAGAVSLVGNGALQTPYPAGVYDDPSSFGSLDDNFWGGIPVGFNFNFFGNTVTNVFIGSNGTISLGSTGSTAFTFTDGFPSTTSPASTIAVVARDLHWNRTGSGKISYWTEGIAPNRRFVVQFLNGTTYGQTAGLPNGTQTAEAVFYETLGTIDIRVFEATFADAKYIGLQDGTQLIGATAPNCAATPATPNYWNGVTNEIAATAPQAWRFSPPASYTTTWYADGVAMPSVTADPSATPPVVGYANPGTNVFSIPVAPVTTTTYSITYTNLNSGCSNAPGSAQVVMAILGNTIPAGLNSVVSSNTICLGQSVNLSTTYTGTNDGLVFQWQNSIDGGTTWNDIASANALTLTHTPEVPSQYRCKLVACNGVPGYTSAVSVGFNNSVLTSTAAVRCGVGTATLTATGSTGATLNWYTSASGGAAIGTGTSFLTPTINTSTTYYVGAETITPQAVNVGSTATPSSTFTTSSTNGGMVFNTTIANVRINSADIFVSGTGDMVFNLQDASGVDIATTTLTGVVGSTTGLTTVNFPSTFVVPNIGIGYKIICTSLGTGLTWYYQTGAYPFNTPGVSITSGWGWSDFSTDLRCIHKLNFTLPTVCSSSRTPVVVTVTPPPAITLSANPATICAESNTTPVTVVTGASDYSSYVWSPTSVTGNSTTGWVFNPLTTTTYTLLASQTTGATPCANIATVSVNVNPTPSVITISSTPVSACANIALPLVATGGSVSTVNNFSMDVLPTNFTLEDATISTVALNTNYYSQGTGSVLFNAPGTSANASYSMNSNLSMTDATSATLTFSHIAAMEGTAFSYDYGYVEYSVNGGTTWVTFTPSDYSGTATTTVFNANARFTTRSYADWITQFTSSTSNPGVGPATSLWKTETFNIPASALTSSQFRIRFRYTTDSSTNFYGWLIDDVKVNKTIPTTMAWTPTANLYTDAAATTPYTGQNLSTVYFKTNAAAAAVTYTATATSTLGCPRVATVPVTVYQTAAPTGVQFYQFCPSGGATVSSMSPAMIGSNIKWYSVSTGGTALAPTTPLTQGYYWASQTLNGCESPTRYVVFAISNATAAPSSSASQQFCNSATVANLTANGSQIKWYNVATGGTALASTAALSTGTYYATQTSGGCESPRTAVSVTVTAVSAPTGAATQSLSSLLTLGDIVVTGSNIVWYASAANAASGTNPLASTQLLANTTYYATQTINGCTSNTSLAVTITTLANQDFDMTQFTFYPNPVIDLLNITYSQDMTSVKVFNMVGQQLMSKQVNSNTVQVDMSSYANGAYFIQVTTENAMKTVRVIKK